MVMQVLYEGLADSKYRPCPLLVKYVEAGWLGRKTESRGFYDFIAANTRCRRAESQFSHPPLDGGMISLSGSEEKFRGEAMLNFSTPAPKNPSLRSEFFDPPSRGG